MRAIYRKILAIKGEEPSKGDLSRTPTETLLAIRQGTQARSNSSLIITLWSCSHYCYCYIVATTVIVTGIVMIIMRSITTIAILNVISIAITVIFIKAVRIYTANLILNMISVGLSILMNITIATIILISTFLVLVILC